MEMYYVSLEILKNKLLITFFSLILEYLLTVNMESQKKESLLYIHTQHNSL